MSLIGRAAATCLAFSLLISLAWCSASQPPDAVARLATNAIPLAFGVSARNDRSSDTSTTTAPTARADTFLRYDDRHPVASTHIRATDSVLAARGAERASPGRIVLGRNMRERVIPYAERTGAEYYKGTPRGLRWLPQSFQVGLNRWWLRRRIKQGYDIEDIGAGRGPLGRSPYYEGEHRTLGHHGYPRYRRVDPGD